VRIAMAIARGAQALADEGYVHNDIKPNNIFIDGARPDTVRLGDVGNARRGGRVPTRWGVPEKTGWYPPAKARIAGINDDVYAIAKVLGYLLTGRRNPLRQIAHAPAALRPILERALDPDPSRRFATPNELLRALEPFSGR
jgi:serine/threonine protein kinase